ncbi:hypothetical protein [Patulibacter sp.]|uniref:hypothetical protein n=1 Tax=Patulibacter sp. TaxID=1912859 RepID=UPI002728874D|nr:hypothetical protein [Patulibacter sp.]MDO9409665.1 hypothetical protein [Patulibacter sp.]
MYVTSRPSPVRPAALLLSAVALGALGAVGTAPAAAAPGPLAPTVLSVEQNDTPVDGWGGWLVWSRRDDDGRYRLVARTPDGTGVQLGVAPQDAPIDAGIGPGPDGTPLVVYTVCKQAATAVPTGCDVRRLDVLTGVDAPVPAASSPDVDERFPAVWGSRIAFSRPASAARPLRTGIAIADLGSTTAVGPTVFGTRTEKRGRRRVASPEYGPQGIDLRRSVVAASWRTAGAGPERWRLIVRRGSSAPRTVVSATTNRRTLSRLGRPALSAHEVVAPRQRAGTTNRSELLRSTLSGKRMWTLGSGFSDAQSERYGSALSAVTRITEDRLVVVRRLASDGRWSCKHPLLPDARGCELLQLDAEAQPWRRVAR